MTYRETTYELNITLYDKIFTKYIVLYSLYVYICTDK